MSLQVGVWRRRKLSHDYRELPSRWSLYETFKKPRVDRVDSSFVARGRLLIRLNHVLFIPDRPTFYGVLTLAI